VELKRRHKGSNALYVRSHAVDEETMKTGHLLELVLCVPLGTLTLTVGLQERHLTHYKPHPTNPTGALPGQVKNEDLRGNRLTQVLLNVS